VFTGIVSATGTVLGLESREHSARLTVAAKDLLRGVRVGSSIAVNGVCLTIVQLNGGAFEADLAVETLRLTTLGRLEAGAPVNLELPLAVGDRLGGHLVQGHVDGVGLVTARREEGEAWWLEIAAPEPLMRYVIEKGSVTIDGVSLTVATVSEDRFTVCLIPHTCAVTTLGRLAPGAQVNLEMDVLAKYVERLVSPGRGASGAGMPPAAAEPPQGGT
jgi:riboflavin synthase